MLARALRHTLIDETVRLDDCAGVLEAALDNSLQVLSMSDSLLFHEIISYLPTFPLYQYGTILFCGHVVIRQLSKVARIHVAVPR